MFASTDRLHRRVMRAFERYGVNSPQYHRALKKYQRKQRREAVR